MARPAEGAYEIVRDLGLGGMGAVYLAVRADREFRTRVAIKLIPQRYAVGGHDSQVPE